MIVRSGSPFFSGLAPLVPTRIGTIEGRERFGGRRPTGGAGVFGGGRFPMGLNLGRSSRGLRGLGADYCRSNPPDANTIALIQAAGGTVNLIDCAYSTGTRNPGAPSGPVLNPAAAGPQPVQAVIPPPQYEDCNPNLIGPAGSTACAARNLQRQRAWEQQVGQSQSDFNRAECIWNGVQNGQDLTSYCSTIYPVGYAGSGSPVTVPIPMIPNSPAAPGPGAPAASSYSPSIRFSGGSAIKVGDSWTIAITGAQPNAPVLAVVSGPKNFPYQAGVTDQSGNFTLTGTATPDQVGDWSEVWSAGGQTVGTVRFTVLAPAGSSSPAAGSSSSGAVAPVSSLDVGAVLSESSFFGIPNWALAVVAVGAVFFVGGGHH